MKVIFLDFDGVITIPLKWKINPDKLKLVKKIVDETGAKIVVSSSWRMTSVKETIDKMIGRPSKCPKNKMINWFIDNLYDVTPWHADKKYYGSGRGGEIQTYLDAHQEIDNYVIIDDDSDMLDSQLFHFVQTNYVDGIGEFEAIRAIQVLNRLWIQNNMSLNFELRYQHLLQCNGLPNKADELWSKYDDTQKDMNIRYN